MTSTVIRNALPADLPRIVEIYNYYISETPITFDVEPYSVDTRRPWFDEFASQGRYRLLVAEEAGVVVGYVHSARFRPKPAYDVSIETTVYLVAEAQGRGIGRRLYEALFDALRGQDVHRAYAGITLPNPASVALHEALGFERIGVWREVGRKLEAYHDVAWYEKALGP